MPLSSTTSSCMSFVNDIQYSLDNSLTTACLALDLSKAFDSIYHPLLLYKLRKIGFSISALNMIDSYLSNRKQSIVVGDDVSNMEQVTHGVPQGSILGPTLFNLYLTDIFELKLFGNLSMYADDGMLTYSENNLNELEKKCKKIY